MIYEITDLIHEKLIEAGVNNPSYGIEGELNLDKQNLLPLAHIVLATSQQSNYNQVTFLISVMDVLATTSILNRSEMTNAFGHVQNLIDLQNSLNIVSHKFINLLYNADTDFYQRLDNTPILQWNDDFAKDGLVGYDFELVFNLTNTNLAS